MTMHEICDCVWLNMALYNNVLLYVTMHDYLWPCMTFQYCVWLSMTKYNFLWLPMITPLNHSVFLHRTKHNSEWLCMIFVNLFHFSWHCNLTLCESVLPWMSLVALTQPLLHCMTIDYVWLSKTQFDTAWLYDPV